MAHWLLVNLAFLTFVALSNQRYIPRIDDIVYNAVLSQLVRQYDLDYTTPSDFDFSMSAVGLWGPIVNPEFGQVAGVAVDPNGGVYIFHRGDHKWDGSTFNDSNFYTHFGRGPILQDSILKLDSMTGQIKESYGKGRFYMPHGFSFDNKGNFWLTDVALHQVFKYSRSSMEPLLVLGEAGIPGSDDNHFCKPTDVVVASTGEFFVSDGYCNNRIMKFSADGKLLTQWGRPTVAPNTPQPGEFLIPHGVALSEENDLLCVADRENRRVQCFTAGLKGSTAGKFQFEVVDPQQATVYGIDSIGDNLYIVSIPTGNQKSKGYTINVKKKEIVDTWGPVQGFSQPHDVAMSLDGKIAYVAEIGPNQLWTVPLTLH